jgi:outer membrane receptor for ferrienterochelin and colicins
MSFHHLTAAIAFLMPLVLLAQNAQPDSSSARHSTDSLRTIQANQVVVTGTRNEIRLKDSPVRVEVIGKERLTNTAMADLGDVLKEQTGLVLTGTVRSGIQMNGLGPDYTLILIDGQPVIGRVAGVLDLTRLSIGNVERIEVVKGPMSSMYGSEALAGVVNIITKRPDDGFNGNVLLQSLSRGPTEIRTELGYGSDSLEVSGFVNYKQQAPFSLPLGTASIPYAGFEDGTAQAKLQWRFHRGWKATQWIRGFRSVSNGAFIESVAGQIAQNSGSVIQSDVSTTTSLEYALGRARLNMTAYGSVYNERYNFDTIQGDAGTIDDLRRRIGRLYAQYDVSFNTSNRLMLGGEFLYDDIAGSRYRDSSGSTPLYRTGVAFVQWEGLPTSWISYVLSSRLDHNSVYGTAISPRFSLLWKPNGHLRVSGSIGSGFKAPDFRQLFVTFSNRLAGAGYDLIGAQRLGVALEPERSVSYDAGLRYEDGHRQLTSSTSLLYNAEIRGFRNDLSNLIEFYYVKSINGRDVYSYRNVAQAYTQGIEANLTLALAHEPTGLYSLSGGYQFLDAADVQVLRAIDNGTAGYIGTGKDVPLTRDAYQGLWGRSRHSGTIRLQYDTPDKQSSVNIRLQLIGRFGDESLDKNGYAISDPPRKVLDRDDEFVAGYTVVNASYTTTITFAGHGIKVGVGVQNALDIATPTRIPGLVGRQFYLQSSTQF